MDEENQDENTQVDDETNRPGQSQEDETAEHDTPTELPSDPVALKELAEQQAKDLKEQKRVNRQAKRDLERQREDTKAQQTKADYWANEAKRQQESGGTAPREGKRANQPDDEDDTAELEAALSGVDLYEFIKEDENGNSPGGGAPGLAKALKKAGFVTKKDMQRYSRDVLDGERKRTTQLRSVGERHAWLNEQGQMQDDAFKEFDTIKAEKPHLNDDDVLELAALRVEVKHGYKPGDKKTSHGNGATDRDRLRAAQGSPGGRGPSSGKAPAKISESDIQRTMRVHGLEYDAAKKITQRAADAVQQSQRNQARPSA